MDKPWSHCGTAGVFSWEGEFVAAERMLSAPQIYMRVLRYVTIISIYTTATKQVPMLELFEWSSICGDWDALDPGREDFTVLILGVLTRKHAVCCS